MKKLLLFLSAAAICSCTHKTNKLDTIIPKPVKVEKTDGDFILTKSTSVSADSSFGNVGAYLANKIKIPSGIDLPAGSKAQNGIYLKKLTDPNDLGKEGYILSIDKDAITISANEPNGAFYGAQTLLQLISADSVPGIPCGKITDKPRFGWRGYMLDPARMFYPVEFVKKQIDLLAMHKLNILHLHLTDDEGGWRIEIKKYPRLTEMGSWRRNINTAEPFFEKGDSLYGGYYTQEQIRELIRYASKQYITIIPEIEMPGHSAAALYAYPELTCIGEKSVRREGEAFTDPFCAGNEKTFELLQDVLSEMIDLFPSEYIHIGGDECKKTPWEKCSKCQKRMKDENLQNVKELQSYFIKRIEKYVTSKGKRIIGWDEILEGGLAPDATVMSWQGEEGGTIAAKQGHDVIMSPIQFVYFNNRQIEEREFDPTAGPIRLLLDRVYGYDPVPAGLSAEEAKHVLGVEACLWAAKTENVEFRTLPRLCALSETAWSAEESINYDDFLNRMTYQYKRLMKYGYDFFIPLPKGLPEYKCFTDETTIKIFSDIPDAVIRYTLDNSVPTINSTAYQKPFKTNQSVVVKARTYLPNGKESPVFTSFFQKAEDIEPTDITDVRNGLTLSYFKGSFKSIFDFISHKPDTSYSIGTMYVPFIHVLEDFFALRFAGYIYCSRPGDYIFYTTSDDGSALYLNDRFVVYNDGCHGSRTMQGRITLRKGFYKFRFEYFNNTGGKALKAEYEGPGIIKQEIPARILFH